MNVQDFLYILAIQKYKTKKHTYTGTSLGVQQLRVHLPKKELGSHMPQGN